MYEWNEEDKKIDFSHNPFSMPQGGLEALDAANDDEAAEDQGLPVRHRLQRLSRSRSGAIRNHMPDVMLKAFEIAGLRRRSRRGAASAACSRAFQYGAPPHGGMAPGIDRIVMLLAGAKNLREVIAVPDEPAGQGPADGRAERGHAKQLRELCIRVMAEPRKEN